MKAKDLLDENEQALILFTDGTEFDIEDDKTGLTGKWKVNPERVPDRIIIYFRDSSAKDGTVYSAINTGVAPSEIDGRHFIFLANIENVGSTDLDWVEFAEGGQNPVRYLTETRNME